MLEEANLVQSLETERRIIELVAQGHSNREISRIMQVSEHIVNRRLRTIARKLGVADRFELILYAIVHGLTGTAEAFAAIPPQTQETERVAAA